MRSGFNFKAAAVVSALWAAGFIALAVLVILNARTPDQVIYVLLAFCAAGLGGLGVIISAAAHAVLNR